MTNNYRVVVHFDGTEYYGWQFQTAEYPTIQAELIRILKIIAKKHVLVTGSSRTDAGVHSSGLTANFHLPVTIEPDSLKRALNSLLPRDIRIVECELMDKSFNARFGAVSKTYVYRIFTGQSAVALQPALRFARPFSTGREAMQEPPGISSAPGILPRSAPTNRAKRSGKWTSAKCRSRKTRSPSPCAVKLPALRRCATWSAPDRRRPKVRANDIPAISPPGPPARRADRPAKGLTTMKVE
jgi:tRNA U38,U39,U40 pseudouridine synthase TruA